MLQSEIFNFGLNLIKKSFLLSCFAKQVDMDKKAQYRSRLLSMIRKRTYFFYHLINRFLFQNDIFKAAERFDLRSAVLFLFIVAQVIFPGYGTQDTGVAFLPGSPTASSENYIGFLVSLTIFILFSCLVFLFFLKDLIKNRTLLRFSRFEIILLVFLISLEISSIFSIYSSIAFLWTLKVVRGIIFYFIFSRLVIEKKNLKAICLAFIFIIFIESGLAFLQFINKRPLGLPIETALGISSVDRLYLSLSGEKILRPFGTLSQPNVLAFILGFSLPFLLFFTLVEKKINKIIGTISISLCLFTLIITLSRWGAVTVAFSLITFSFLAYIKKLNTNNINVPLLFKISIFSLALFVLVISIRRDFLARFLIFSSEDTSLAKRLQLITQAKYVFQHNPLFGIGGGTFSKYLLNYDFTQERISQFFPAPVHSLFLLLLSEAGIISSLFFLFLMLYLLVSFVKHIFETGPPVDHFSFFFKIALFVSSMSYLFNGLWTVRSLDEHLIILFWINVGLYFNIIKNKNLA